MLNTRFILKENSTDLINKISWLSSNTVTTIYSVVKRFENKYRVRLKAKIVLYFLVYLFNEHALLALLSVKYIYKLRFTDSMCLGRNTTMFRMETLCSHSAFELLTLVFT